MTATCDLTEHTWRTHFQISFTCFHSIFRCPCSGERKYAFPTGTIQIILARVALYASSTRNKDHIATKKIQHLCFWLIKIWWQHCSACSTHVSAQKLQFLALKVTSMQAFTSRKEKERRKSLWRNSALKVASFFLYQS